MAKNNTFTSVSDLVKSISSDKEFEDGFNERLESRQIVKSLVALRAAKGVSQSKIAEAIGCGQSRISKLENGLDEDLRIGDIRSYMQALGCSADVLFANRHQTLFQRVKLHAVGMRDAFLKLAELAQKDDDIARGVAYTHVDAFMHLAEILQDTLNELPVCPDNGRPYVTISSSVSAQEDGHGIPATNDPAEIRITSKSGGVRSSQAIADFT